MNPYSSHLAVLKFCLENVKIENILEFGCGLYSTKLFCERAKCLSIEMQDAEWAQKVKAEVSNADIITSIGGFEYKKLNLDFGKYDLIFVDGHGESRYECINDSIQSNAPIIVAHDFETPSYKWNKIVDNNYYKFVYTKTNEHTLLLTTNEELFNKVKTIL